MSSITFITACAVLSVLVLGWVLYPLRNDRAFYAFSILCALLTLGLYLMMGAA